MGKKYLITGATGFIGNHLVKACLTQGSQVKCLVTAGSKTEHLKQLGAEIYYGDVLDKKSLVGAVRGVDIVYHLASRIRPSKVISSDSALLKAYRSINIKGTRNLTDVCLSNRIQRFIYFSSMEAVGIGKGLTEESPCRPLSDYGRSKLEAEKHILNLARIKDLPILIVRPGLIYGPGNLAMLPLFRLVKNKFMLTVRRGANFMPFCYIDDLIEGTLLVERLGRVGSIYHIAGKQCTFNEFIYAIAENMGVRPNVLDVSEKLIQKIIFVKESVESIIRLRVYPFCMHFSSASHALFCNDWSVSYKKAEKELNYAPHTDLGTGVRLAIQWYKQNGYL